MYEMEHFRLECLRIAHNVDEPKEDVVARAGAYAAFVIRQTGEPSKGDTGVHAIHGGPASA